MALTVTPDLIERSCLVVVHAGYAINSSPGSEARGALSMAGRYGNYHLYQDNLTRLFDALERLQFPEKVLLVGKSYMDRKGYPPFVSRNGEKIAETGADTGLIKRVEYNGTEISRRQFYETLRRKGIDTVIVVGEWAYFGNNISCLGGVVKSFSLAGFEIMSICGCVFPSKEDHSRKTTSKIYTNSVALEDILRSALAN